MARYYYKTTQSISKTVSFRHEYVCEKCGDTVSGIQNELLSSHEYKSAGNVDGLQLTEDEGSRMKLDVEIQAANYRNKIASKIKKNDYSFFEGHQVECPNCKRIQSWSVSKKLAIKYFIYSFLVALAAVLLILLLLGDTKNEAMDWIVSSGTLLLGGFWVVAFISIGHQQLRAAAESKNGNGIFPQVTILD